MKKYLLIIIALLLSNYQSIAQQFSVANREGVLVHYRVQSQEAKTVAVSFGKEFGAYTGKVVVPSSVFFNNENYTVTDVEIYAFYLCNGLTEVELPNTITTIGENSFANCNSLKRINIPSSVTKIGEQAFADCNALESITIPNSVVSIGEKAFNNCASLTQITLPTTMTAIRDGMFKGCSKLQSIVIPQQVTTIGISAFAGCSSLESITIPNSVKIIQGSAFTNCSSLREVTIPNSVTTIEGSAFSGCKELVSVTLSTAISSIAASTFADCSNLSEITLPAMVQTIGINAFSGTYLSTINIPNSVYVIDDNAFANCPRLSAIDIPNSVTTIGRNAFAGCQRLTTITIGTNVSSIGASAFADIPNISTVIWNARHVTYYPNGQFSNDYQNPFYNSYINRVKWGENVQSIPAYAFHSPQMNQYGHIDELPSSVSSIGDYAFYNCKGISKLNIGAVRSSDIEDYSIGAFAFAGCNDLTSINIGGAITHIDSSAFAGCQKLVTVKIGDSVSTIGERAFEECSNLKDLTIGASLTHLGDGAFRNAKRLTNLKWNARNASSDATNIHPFEGCSNLTSITIGYWSQALPTYLFNNGLHLTDLIVLAPTPPAVAQNTFNNISSKTSVFVPCNSLTLYQTSTYWKHFMYVQGIGDCQHKMMVLANNNIGGTVSGAGNYKDGATATAKATANAGFIFSSWNDGNTNNPRNIVVTRDTLLIANFSPSNAATPSATCTLTTTVNNAKMGSITGGGTYQRGAYAQIAAMPNIGYKFVKWNDGNTENPRMVNITDDQVYVAEFIAMKLAPSNNENPIVTLQQPIQPTYNSNANSGVNYALNIVSVDNTLGTTVGSGYYPGGCVISIVAIPQNGSKFVRWNDGNTENPRQVRVNQNATYVALFDNAGFDSGYIGNSNRDNLTVKYDEQSGKATILTEKVKSVKIYNPQGKKVAQYGNIRLIDFSAWNSGQYTLLIELPDGIAIRKVNKR